VNVSVDFQALTVETVRAIAMKTAIRNAAWQAVQTTAVSTMNQIKVEMPVKTGRAQGSWGKLTGPALPGDDYWVEDENDLSIEQGSTVYYVANLEQGSSMQAPAGFIEAAALRGQNELDSNITRLIDAST